MISERVHIVKVLLVLVILIAPQFLSVSGESSSKSRSKSMKAKSSSHQRSSGHQALTLKPSKPDPHFDILDEQRGINYGARLRDGRDGSRERKPTKLKEASMTDSESSNISATRHQRKSNKKGKSKSIVISPSSLESAFLKKSTEVAERTQPMFSGSVLISGEAGPFSTSYSRRTENVEKDGWKILMGPSVSPDESGVFDERPENRRSFTSLTDGLGKHRTITTLKASKKGKSISNSHSHHKLFDANEIRSRKVSRLIEAEKDASTPKEATTSRRNMPVSIPKQNLKHKYATITRRVPSKPKDNKKQVKTAYGSRNRSKVLKPSKQVKSSLETLYASIENDVNQISPVMTLDSKKLVIEPVGLSAEPTTLSVAATSMSTETFSGEREPTHFSPMSHKLQPRFDPLQMNIGDSTTETVDGNYGSHQNHFQTKTALHSAEYPFISVSASMNYPSTNHHKEQGGIITASSFSNMNMQHHVEDSGRFPALPQFSPSLLAEAQEPSLKNDFLEELENMHHNLPVSPHVEFIDSNSKLAVSPPLVESVGGPGRLPLINARVKSNLKPSRTRFPLELASPPSNFHLRDSSRVSSENSYVTASRYPHFPVGTLRPVPPPHDSLARPSIPPNFRPIVHPPPMHIAAHNHHVPLIHPPPHHHHHHPLPPFRHPPPPLPPLRLGPVRPPPPPGPFDVGSGRKAPPPGDFVIEMGKLGPGHNPPPPIGIDPDHPAVQHALKNPHALLNDGVFIEPTDSTNVQETTKNYLHNLHYQVHRNTLIPLDKRLVYLSMIFSWMFWITTFYTYYRWSATGNKAKKIILNVPNDGDSPQVTASLPLSFIFHFLEISNESQRSNNLLRLFNEII